MENQKTIVQGFSRFNLLLRPDALKHLMNLQLSYTQLDVICQGCFNLGLHTNIIEIEHIEQVRKLHQQVPIITQICQGRDATVDVIKTLQQRLMNAITIVDTFESVDVEQQPDANQKITMHTGRITQIRDLIAKDPRYCKSNEQQTDHIILLPIGSVVGRTILSYTRVNLIGMLLQFENQQYYLSDGTTQVLLNLQNAKHINIYNPNLPKGLINVGHIIIINGIWDEHENCVKAFEISQPFTTISKQQQAPNQIRYLVENDSFGSFSKVYRILNQLTQIKELTLNKQKALQFFSMEYQPLFSFWVLSEFSMSSLSSIQNFSKLLNQTENYKQDITLPRAIFIVGQFVNSLQEMRQNKPLAQEFCNLLSKHSKLLADTIIFFVPSAKDPPLAYSLPHAPISLSLLLHSQDLPSNLHSLSNPVKLNFNGLKLQIIQSDTSREMRRSHIMSTEVLEIDDVCETIWAQRNLGSYLVQQQIVYKWNHTQALQISDETQLLILADSTLPQFTYQSLLCMHLWKGEFMMCSVENGDLSVEKCKI